MIDTLQMYFWLFLTYSFFGWSIEVLLEYLRSKRFVNRGFLIGPYCPIYGWGALFITILLRKYQEDPVALFFLGMILCAVLEYMTSYVLEKIFRARWWDYSNDKFNINGRICLNTMIPFGLLGVLISCSINPFLIPLFQGFHGTLWNVVTILVFGLFLIDNMISVHVLSSVRKDNKLYEKDSTEEMSKIVREHIKNSGFLKKRLLFAFPDFQYIGVVLEKAKVKIHEQKGKYNEKQKEIMRETEEKITKMEEKFHKRVTKLREKANQKIVKISEKDKKEK